MKKLLIAIILTTGILYADLLDDAVNAYSNGENAKAVELWTKSCDGGNMKGCSDLGDVYRDGYLEGLKTGREEKEHKENDHEQ